MQSVSNSAEQPAYGRILAGLRDQVRGNRVHADDNQREGPAARAFHIDCPAKCREEPKTNSAAEESPGRRPDSFHDWTDSSEVKQCSSGDADGARDCQPAQRDSWRRIA